MALKERFTQMRKCSASNKEGEDLENFILISESDTEIQNTDFEPATKHSRIDRDSHITESDSTCELSFSGSSTSAMKKQKIQTRYGVQT